MSQSYRIDILDKVAIPNVETREIRLNKEASDNTVLRCYALFYNKIN